jgi:hypothetical protein
MLMARALFVGVQVTAVAAWSLVGSPGSTGLSGGSVQYTAVAMDSTNQPWVVFRDGANSNKASVMSYNGETWADVGARGFSTAAVIYSCMELTSSNQPYVAVVESNQPTVYTYSSSSWSVVGSAGVGQSMTITSEIDIRMKSDGNPFVIFHANVQGNFVFSITAVEYDGSSWNLVGTSGGVSPGGAAQIALALSPSDTPYVAYRDGTRSNKLIVTSWDSETSSWGEVGGEEASTGLSTGAVWQVQAWAGSAA